MGVHFQLHERVALGHFPGLAEGMFSEESLESLLVVMGELGGFGGKGSVLVLGIGGRSWGAVDVLGLVHVINLFDGIGKILLTVLLPL